MNPGLRPVNWMKDLQRVRQCEVGFRADEQIAPGKRFGSGDQNRTGIRGSGLVHVFGVVEKTQILLSGVVEGPDRAHAVLSVTHDFGAETPGQLGETEASIHWAVLKRRITSSVMSIASSAYTSPDWNLLKISVKPCS